MARFLFLNIPAKGHVNPTLPMVCELLRRGESITYMDSELARSGIMSSGVDFLSYEELAPNLEFFPPGTKYRSFALFPMAWIMARFTEGILPPLLAWVEAKQPALILHDFTAIWGRLLTQVTGIPAICTVPQFPVSKHPPDPYPGHWGHLLKMLTTGIGKIGAFNTVQRRLVERYGVPPMSPFDLLSNYAQLNLVMSSRAFVPYSEDFDSSFEFVGPQIADRSEPLDEELAAFVSAHERLIYISLGSVIADRPEFFRACIEALRDLDVGVVMSARMVEQTNPLGPLPPNFIARPYIPQLEMLQRSTLFITHGGMNSVSEGLYYEVPLLVIPQEADMSSWWRGASRSSGRGALSGRRHHARRTSGRRSMRCCQIHLHRLWRPTLLVPSARPGVTRGLPIWCRRHSRHNPIDTRGIFYIGISIDQCTCNGRTCTSSRGCVTIGGSALKRTRGDFAPL